MKWLLSLFGKKTKHPHHCEKCGGAGRLTVWFSQTGGMREGHTKTCTVCSGKGVVWK